MAIELPPRPDVLEEPLPLDERLASLEDPLLTERLFRENPALFAQDPPRTQREILAWTTRGFGTALLAVTAAVSIAAGYLGFERTRGTATAPKTTPRALAAAVPVGHSAPPQRRTASRPASPARTAVAAPRAQAAQHHASAPLGHAALPPALHHASAPVQHPTSAAVQHRAPAAVAAYHPVVRSAMHTAPVLHPAPAHHAAPAPAAQTTAAAQLAAWEATHPASAQQSRSATAAEPAPRTRPQTEPATGTETGTAAGTGPVTTGTGGAPEPARDGGVRTPPTNPGGVWTERIPHGGTLGGAIGPVIGVPRDSCTPRGGRTGIVMEALSVLMSSRR